MQAHFSGKIPEVRTWLSHETGAPQARGYVSHISPGLPTPVPKPGHARRESCRLWTALPQWKVKRRAGHGSTPAPCCRLAGTRTQGVRWHDAATCLGLQGQHGSFLVVSCPPSGTSFPDSQQPGHTQLVAEIRLKPHPCPASWPWGAVPEQNTVAGASPRAGGELGRG